MRREFEFSFIVYYQLIDLIVVDLLKAMMGPEGVALC
jgi:hypothetical protein